MLIDAAPALAAPRPANLRTAPPRRRRFLALICLVGAGLVLVRWWQYDAWQDDLARQLVAPSLGELDETTGRDLRREDELAEARIVLARALLTSELRAGASRDAAPEAEEAQQRTTLARLALAGDLARATLAERPASADARLLAGATTFILRSKQRDTRLFSAYRDWETPLLAAERLDPSSPEPSRLLAGAYLEIWPALAPAKRQQALARLRDAFTDRPTLERLLTLWLAVAGSIEEAAPLLPDEPWIWQRLAAAEAQGHRWSEYVELVRRERRAQHTALEARLVEAAARMQGGDFAGAQPIYLEVAASLAPAADFAPLLERALAGRPPGPVGGSMAGSARAWLDWALALCMIGDCPLSPEAIDRLAAAAPGLQLSEEALAALAADDLARGERIERRAQSQWSESWGPYLILKARRLAALGQGAEAAATLASVHRNLHGQLAFALARVAIGARPRAGRAAGGAAFDLASPVLDPFRRTAWSATDWLWQGKSARLPLLPGRAASGLALRFDAPTAVGSVVQVQWNGRALPLQIVDAQHPAVTLGLDVQPAPALLQVQTIAGQQVRPAAVELGEAR